MYDLIIRDATIVSSAGRLVADVAVKAGKIAYVGPRPPRRTKREMSAIGKFLLPGLIDTGASLAPSGSADEWQAESRAAVTGGTTTVLALPGPDAIVDHASAEARIASLAGHSWCNHGFWAMATEDSAAQLASIPSVVALLARLGEVPLESLRTFVDLGVVLGVQHAGDTASVRPNPEGIPDGSPEALEVMRLTRELGHSLHWSHLSTSAELDLLDPVRGDLPVTCSVTPHHLFLSEEEDEGVLISPPLRTEQDRRTLWTAVRRGRLDCIASDHRPTARGEVGAPSAELTFPLMLSAVRLGRLSLEQLASMCAENPARIFGLPNKGRIEKGADADLLLFSEDEVTRVDEKTLMSGAGWSPYATREVAPKPDLVMVGGQTTAVRGELVGSEPIGTTI